MRALLACSSRVTQRGQPTFAPAGPLCQFSTLFSGERSDQLIVSTGRRAFAANNRFKQSSSLLVGNSNATL